MEKSDKLITVAIHTYAKALILKTMLENEGIPVVINNVNLIQPVVSSGVRVRIKEKDLPLALKLIEQMADDEFKHNEDSNKPVVLIPIDFSDYSKKACLIGFDFAKQMGGRVILLHSYVEMTYAMAMMPFSNEDTGDKHAEQKALKRMNDFEIQIKNDISNGILPGVKFTCRIEEGVPEVTIIECAKLENATLIVMGTRGKSKKEEELIGSVTAEVLDEGKFTVFSVPEGMEARKMSELKNVAFFSNFIQQDLLSFDIFARLFKNRKLNITIIPIETQKNDDKTKKYLDQLVQYCQSHYSDFNFKAEILSPDNYAKDFDEYVKAQNIDLMLIPNKKRNIFSRLFSPSVAHRMVFHSDVPLLVVPIS
jgi:nucleotide-binding universal stress UspA family protein